MAAAWYEAHGYEVVARNWRCRLGEIDLVCRQGRTLVVCEVKSRRSGRFGTPEEAVSPSKRRRLRRLAASWLSADATPAAEVRFDVACVAGGTLTVVHDAF
jgi:putative endonuclease